jgi:hypothetical protein
MSERAIQRHDERARKIGEDNLLKIKGTSLDKPGELDALARLDPEVIDALCARAAAGEEVSAKAVLNPDPAPMPEPQDHDRWRELNMDEAAAEEAKERAEAEAEAEAQAQAQAQAEESDDADDEEEGPQPDPVDNDQLLALLKQLDAILFDPSFVEKDSDRPSWENPAAREIEDCTVDLYELIDKINDGLRHLHSQAYHCPLVEADRDAKAQAAAARQKAKAEADAALVKAEWPKLRQRAEKLGLSLSRRGHRFYLNDGGRPLVRGFNIHAVIEELDDQEKEAAKLKVAA